MDLNKIIPTNQETNQYDVDDLMKIVRILRSEDGCPWDKVQTHESLKTCIIEECYEVVEAINNKDKENLIEELGDVLLQVALHTVIGENEDEFSLSDVTDGISRKMIHRHPHVFGNTVVKDSEGVIKNWEAIKREEKQEKSVKEAVTRVPRALPANIRAAKVQKKAREVGFDFANYEEALKKVYEEINELNTARNEGNFDHIQEEFGDLMFSVVNLSRFLQLNAENSLTNATDKFINRLVDVERLALREGKHLCGMSIDELEALWGRVK